MEWTYGSALRMMAVKRPEREPPTMTMRSIRRGAVLPLGVVELFGVAMAGSEVWWWWKQELRSCLFEAKMGRAGRWRFEAQADVILVSYQDRR